MYSNYGNRNALLQQKPENVLKRANDLIASAIGNNADREKKIALEQLHGHISARGKRSQMSQWSKIYETVMKRHLELCVDLKDERTAKDGLHQYRNLCQAVDPSSLEVVVVHLMDLAEARARAARAKADKVALAAAAKISDLEQEETPESIMLSSMTEEGERDRTDREVVVPWLKFLWETYRAVLDLLNRNSKLEKVYHKTCEKAFNFCRDFNRTLEFRRLCEMLRAHLVSLQKVSTQPARVARLPWEWTPEGIELHLQTRFSQLEVATTLELWNEGFRTVEDIHNIMQIGGKKSKPRVMATYYEKLTRIFLVSENHLFHAYCWYRYYCLTCESKKELPAADKKVMASAVLLAALCIPSIKETGIMDASSTMAVSLDEDDMAHEKNQRMSFLLDFQSNPTRHALLQDIVNKGLLADVLPGLADLYTNMESKFHPLTLAKSICEAVAVVKATPQLAVYAVPLQRVAVLRVVLQLSRVYSAVKVDFVRSLLAPLSDIPYNQVERVMVDGVSRKQLHLRIDHSEGCLRFGSALTQGNVVDTHVAQFGSTLSKLAGQASEVLLQATGPNALAQVEAAKAAARSAYLQIVASRMDDEMEMLVRRKGAIEMRKEGLERQLAITVERTRISIEEQEARRKKLEDARLEEEAKQRAEADRRRNEEKLAIMKLQKELARYSITLNEEEIVAMSAMERATMIKEAKATEQKAKDDAARRVYEQARRLDHITRAVRIEGSGIIGQKYAEQCEQDRLAHEAMRLLEETKGREAHALDLLEKARMARMQAHRSPFEGPLVAAQEEAFKRREEKRLEKAVVDMRQKRVSRARQRYSDDLEAREAEEEERIERERLEKEAEEKLVRDNQERIRQQREADELEERRIFEAEQKAKRDEERALRMAQAAPAAREGGFPARGEGGGFGSSAPREGGFGAPREGGFGSREGGFAASRGPPGGEGRDEVPRWGARGGGGDAPAEGGGRGGFGEGRGAGREGGFVRPSERREGQGAGEGRPAAGGWGAAREARDAEAPAPAEGGRWGALRGDGAPREGPPPVRRELGFGGDREGGGFGGAPREAREPREGGGFGASRGEGGFVRPSERGAPREGGFGGDREGGGFGGGREPREGGGFGGREGGFGGRGGDRDAPREGGGFGAARGEGGFVRPSERNSQREGGREGGGFGGGGGGGGAEEGGRWRK